MWTMTPIGFFSAVAHRTKPNTVLVRARLVEDLDNLRALLAADDHELPPVEMTPRADYPCRIIMQDVEWTYAAAKLASLVDYDNFKGAVGRRRGRDYEAPLHSVWSAMRRLEALQAPRERATTQPSWSRAWWDSDPGPIATLPPSDRAADRLADRLFDSVDRVVDGEPALDVDVPHDDCSCDPRDAGEVDFDRRTNETYCVTCGGTVHQ